MKMRFFFETSDGSIQQTTSDGKGEKKCLPKIVPHCALR